MYPKRRYTRKTFKKRTYVKKKQSYTKKPSLVKTIKNVVNRQAETKHINMDPIEYPYENANLNNDNSLMYDAVSLTEPHLRISIGNSDGQRVGNKINITKAVINMNFQDVNTTTQGPFIVDVFIGYVKSTKSSLPSASQLSTILQDGSGSTFLNGTTLNLLRNVNKQQFAIVGRTRFKIGASSNGSGHNNNDFPIFVNKKISLKYLLGTLLYDDTNDKPSKNLYMWSTFTSIDSTVLAGALAPEFNYYLDIEYKDF